MALHIVSGSSTATMAVRTLIYDEATELYAGASLTTADGAVVCKPGSLAYTGVFDAPYVLDSDGVWRDADGDPAPQPEPEQDDTEGGEDEEPAGDNTEGEGGEPADNTTEGDGEGGDA